MCRCGKGGIHWSHWPAAVAPLTVSQARLGGALSQPGGAVMSSEGGERSEVFAQKTFDCDRRDSFSPLSPPRVGPWHTTKSGE